MRNFFSGKKGGEEEKEPQGVTAMNVLKSRDRRPEQVEEQELRTNERSSAASIAFRRSRACQPAFLRLLPFPRFEMSKKYEKNGSERERKEEFGRPPPLPSDRAPAEFRPTETVLIRTGNDGAIRRLDFLNRNSNKCGRLLFISDGGI